MLRRSWLIAALALGLLAAPLAAAAQQVGKVYRVGLLTSSDVSGQSPLFGFPGYLPWLARLGYVEGQNVRFEHRYPVGSDEQLAELVDDLLRLQVDIIVASGTPAIRAAKQATRTIPIVMVSDVDPVRAELVASLAKPGGNVTGVVTLIPELSGKRLELLKETVPRLSRVGVLWNPGSVDKAEEWKEAQRAAGALGLELQSLEVRTRSDLERAFEVAAREGVEALLVLADRLITSYTRLIPDLAAKHRLPAMYPERHWVGPYTGGLMVYGPNPDEIGQLVSVYVDKALKGAKPADLPVVQPTRLELWVNVKAAKALGLTLPESILIRADKLIE